MANEQQGHFLADWPSEGSIPDLVSMACPWLPHETIKMDDSSGGSAGCIVIYIPLYLFRKCL